MMQNFQQEIHLEQVASLVNMMNCPGADILNIEPVRLLVIYLTEIRIEHACKCYRIKRFQYLF